MLVSAVVGTHRESRVRHRIEESRQFRRVESLGVALTELYTNRASRSERRGRRGESRSGGGCNRGPGILRERGIGLGGESDGLMAG